MQQRRRRLVDARPSRCPSARSTTATCSTTTRRRCPTRARGGSRTGCTGGRARSTTAAYAWTDGAWTGRQLAGAVLYELHVGTFTPEGTLDAALGRLDHLRDLGVDLVELLPVNAFNGTHSWGYDGVLWSAVHEEYGGPAAYQRFVDGCHAAGIGVVQDVVYNHLGPTRQLPAAFGPYLRPRARTPGARWSTSTARAARRCGATSSTTRAMWFARLPRRRAAARRRARAGGRLRRAPAGGAGRRRCRRSPPHLGRPLTLIAESDLNDPVLVTPREAGGYGLDAQWSDDFHHALHVALTGETDGLLRRLRAARRRWRRCASGGSSTTAPGRRSAAASTGADRHRDDAELAAGGVHPEPRPGRQPRARRPDHRARSTTTSSPARRC